MYQDAVNYLRTPTVSIDSCLSGFSEDEELLALLTLYRRKSDSVDQLFKDPATFRVLSSKAPAQAVETRRSYPINKLEQFLRARSQNLTHFLQILYPAEVFAMAMGLYCRAGFAHSPNPALVVPIPIPALASEESPSPDTKTLADASKSLYTTFMGDSGAMFRLEGTSLFLARLFQRIWPCCICECSQGKYSTIFTPKWTHDEILSSYTYVTRAQELVYSVPERCFPLSAARQVGALRRLLATTSSTLGLMLTLTENDLQKVVRRLSLEDQLLFSKLRVFQLAEQSNLIFALLSALIDTSLDSFNKTCGDLLERCPMFFTDVELARFRGTYALVRMKESARAQEQYPQKDIEDLAERSFAEFSKVPMLNVDHICRVYESFGLFDYVVKLALGRAQNCELRPETLALLFTPSKGPGEHNKFSNDTEELRKIAYKKSCYKVVLSLFSFLKTGVFPDVASKLQHIHIF